MPAVVRGCAAEPLGRRRTRGWHPRAPLTLVRVSPKKHVVRWAGGGCKKKSCPACLRTGHPAEVGDDLAVVEAEVLVGSTAGSACRGSATWAPSGGVLGTCCERSSATKEIIVEGRVGGRRSGSVSGDADSLRDAMLPSATGAKGRWAFEPAVCGRRAPRREKNRQTAPCAFLGGRTRGGGHSRRFRAAGAAWLRAGRRPGCS